MDMMASLAERAASFRHHRGCLTLDLLWYYVRASQREIKCRTPVDRGVGPNAPAVPGDNPLDDGQTDSGTFIVFRLVQALEYSKQLLHITHVKADAVIANIVDGCMRRGRLRFAVD